MCKQSLYTPCVCGEKLFDFLKAFEQLYCPQNHTKSIKILQKFANHAYMYTKTEFLINNRVAEATYGNLHALFTGWLMHNHSQHHDKQRIWTEFGNKGFWTLFGDDWAMTLHALETKGYPFDYR